MDSQKDNNSNIGQNRDKSVSDMYQSDLNKYLFILKKNERLSVALYKITDFLSDNEPLKWSMRAQAVELLSLLGTQVYLRGERTSVLKEAVSIIFNIVRYCEIGKSTGVVSEMNFSILKEEYQHLKKLIETYAGLSRNTLVVFSEEMLAGIQERQDIQPIGHIKDSENVLNELSYIHPVPIPQHKTVSSPHVVSHRMPVRQFQNDRRGTILDFIRKNPGSSIREILKVVPGFSEKTIQRELVALTQEGILKKTGERRWSRYSVA